MMMKKLMTLALAALLLAACVPAFAEGGLPAPAQRTQISVQGTAQITAEPDVVCVTANAEVTAETVTDAQAEMNAIIDSVTAKLLEIGVMDKDIVTANYSYFPVYNYETETPQLTGYRASHTINITCRDTAMLDGVIDAATQNGMSEIYGVNYDVSTRSELYKQALELAVEAAEQKAVRMAQASSMTLSSLISLTENSGYGEGYSVNAAADMAKVSATAVGTGIRSGTVSVSASVTAVYEAGE